MKRFFYWLQRTNKVILVLLALVILFAVYQLGKVIGQTIYYLFN